MLATLSRARGPPPLRRPLSPIPFCVWRIPDPAGAGDGPGAAGASGRDLRGRRSIAGLLRTAAGGLRRALYPSTRCSGSGTRRFSFSRMGGRRRRRWSSRMDLAPPGRAAAVATQGGGARAPLTIRFLVAFGEFRPVEHARYPLARARPAAAAATAVADSFLRLANPGSGWSRGWTWGCRGERPRPKGSPLDRRAVAHSGWGSQAC